MKWDGQKNWQHTEKAKTRPELRMPVHKERFI